MSICVEHTQKGDKDGYGLTSRKGKNVRLHRIVYCDANNIPLTAILGLVIRHTCDNPRCVNPEHLLLGTPQDNIADKVNRNRQARGQAIQQSVLTDEQVSFIREHYVYYSKEWGTPALAKRFNVSKVTIHNVVRKHYWQHA